MILRLVIAYSLLALLIVAAVSTVAWLRYNSHFQRERRRRKAETRTVADLNRELAAQKPAPDTESRNLPEA